MTRIGRCVLPYGGSSAPDPATYCPANGYIPNPVNPDDGWVLLLEFQTNSPSTTTFDPTITASLGDYAWDLGDGTYLVGDKSVSHTYLTTATRTVKLYGKGTCNIIGIDFSADNVVGSLDISNDAFKTLNTISLGDNLSMNNIIWPPSSTGIVSTIWIYNTGIVGILDLSKISAFTTNADIRIYSNASMTGLTFASTITGIINNLSLHSNSFAGTLDLSKISSYTNTSTLDLHNNISMTSILFPLSTITGFIRTLSLYGCSSLGYVDLSNLKTGVSSLNWGLYNNGWSAAVVNQVLYVANSISVAGFTGRVINVGGTNVDPDTTSGGFDGVAARTSLIAKVFTVTIT